MTELHRVTPQSPIELPTSCTRSKSKDDEKTKRKARRHIWTYPRVGCLQQTSLRRELSSPRILQAYFTSHEMGTLKANVKIIAFLFIVVAVFWLSVMARVCPRHDNDLQPRGKPVGSMICDQRQGMFEGTGRVMQEDDYDSYRKHEDIPSPGVGH
ncbi:hypothetical protein Ancab_034574 [Ancistrocladus abbreviatus]